MSKLTFSNAGVTTGQPVLASQVSQSFNAFTGVGDYAITISGSLSTTANSKVSLGGDLVLTDNVSAISQSNFTASAGGGGNVILKYNEATKLATSTNGIIVTGEVDATSIDVSSITASESAIIVGNLEVRNNITASGDILTGNFFALNNAELGKSTSNTTKITGSLHFNDAVGALGSAAMYNDGDTFFFTQSADGAKTQWQTDQFILKNMNNDETLLIANENTDVQLFYNNVRRFATTNEGAYISGSSTSTGLEVHDGTNTAFRSATQTRFDFAGDTYVSNESTSGAARVAFAVGGTSAANAKVAVSSSNDLHVYSGSVYAQSAITTPTGSYFAAGNGLDLENNVVNAIQTAKFFIQNKNVTSTSEAIFLYTPLADAGLHPIPKLRNDTNYACQMNVNLLCAERGEDFATPSSRIAQLQSTAVFGFHCLGVGGGAMNIGTNPSGSITLVNQTPNLFGGGDVSYLTNNGTSAGISVRLVNDGTGHAFNGAGLSVGGTIEITLIPQQPE